jgi:tRNA (guanine37-N1)-methyltransferase
MVAGVTRRAFESGCVNVRLWSLRDFAQNNYRRIDDRPYGGGPGMVMLAEPLRRALIAVRRDRSPVSGPVIHFSPTGVPISQALVRNLACSSGAVLICGRYEGVDQRFLDHYVDMELSLGDFVLSGGELPALALIDAVARLQDGVLGDPMSHQQDSFSDGLLDCPHYSRPDHWRVDDKELSVPGVLLSGNHEAIGRWRRKRALEISAIRRPDLIASARRAGALSSEDEEFLASLGL